MTTFLSMIEGAHGTIEFMDRSSMAVHVEEVGIDYVKVTDRGRTAHGEPSVIIPRGSIKLFRYSTEDS